MHRKLGLEQMSQRQEEGHPGTNNKTPLTKWNSLQQATTIYLMNEELNIHTNRKKKQQTEGTPP
jgi:hypothetical protein